MFLFDLAPDVGGAGAFGIFIVVAFFFIALGSGVFAFVMLRKTIKMAIRLAVVAAVLLIAVFGSIALYLFLQPASPSSRPSRPYRPPVNSTTR
jgi:hypothetical protein